MIVVKDGRQYVGEAKIKIRDFDLVKDNDKILDLFCDLSYMAKGCEFDLDIKVYKPILKGESL